MLEEQSEIDMVEVLLPSGILQVRVADIILRDGEEIGREFSRYVLLPGSDVSQENDKIKAIAAAIWQ